MSRHQKKSIFSKFVLDCRFNLKSRMIEITEIKKKNWDSLAGRKKIASQKQFKPSNRSRNISPKQFPFPSSSQFYLLPTLFWLSTLTAFYRCFNGNDWKRERIFAHIHFSCWGSNPLSFSVVSSKSCQSYSLFCRLKREALNEAASFMKILAFIPPYFHWTNGSYSFLIQFI